MSPNVATRRQVLQGFEDMALEVSARRQGGRNQPGHNDGGPCLTEAADLLMRHPFPERLLIAVSDGKPSGRRGAADDLRTAIAETRRRGYAWWGWG
jgi:nitric oxide reductase activation protein